MHEFAAVKAALEVVETTAQAAGVTRVEEVRLSIGPDSHMGDGRLEDLLDLLAPGSALEGARLVVGIDRELGAAMCVDSIVVNRRESV